MAKYRITGPDGASYRVEAPDGTSLEEVFRVIQGGASSETRLQPPPSPATEEPSIDFAGPEENVRTAIKALPPSMRKKAMENWSKQRVSAERKDAGRMQTAFDVGRNLIRGTPVGSWLDEGVAGAKSLAGGDYEESVALERARNDAADSNATKLGTLPIIGDVTTAGVTKLAGGLASAPFTPFLRAAQGAAMLPRMGAAALTGAGYGAAYGAGEGEGSDRAVNAAIGSTLGGVVGGATPAIAQGIGNAVASIRNMGQRTPAMLQNYSRGAIDRVSRAAADDGVTVGTNPNYQRQSQQLGPESMLADMGENLRGQAGAIANAPGAGQSRIVAALEGRREGAPQRITQDMDAALGPAANVPRSIEATRQHANAQAAPLYDQFRAMRIEPTDHLNELLQRVPTSVFTKARQMAAADGIPIRTHRTRGIDAAELDYVKRALDDMAGSAARIGERSANRAWSNLARQIRTEVDTIISPNDPGQSIWARARRASGEGLQFEEAAEMGQGAFRRSLTPDQMDVDLQGLNPLQMDAYRIGARDAARTTMGNASTAFGPNGDTAARRVLQSQFGAEKLRRIAQNPADADRLAQRLDTETTFATTEQEALRNSATSRRIAAQREFPQPSDRAEVANRVGSKSLSGVALEGAYRIGNLLTAGALNARRARIADDAAQMLTAQGVSRDAIAQGLRQYVARQRLTGDRAAAVSRMIERMERGVAPAQVGNDGTPLEVTIYPSGDPRNNK